MGGIGKTELALQYAITQLEQEKYPGGVCWLRARDQKIAIQITGFAKAKLGLSIPEGLNEIEQTDFCWQRMPQGEVLVVIDDVTQLDAVSPYLPPVDPRFKVLITTRLNLGSSFKVLNIEELSDVDALKLLESLAGAELINSQANEDKELCKWVGNLPLGLELLGRYLARKPDLALNQILERLDSKRLEAKALIESEPLMTAQLGVAAALELSWAELNVVERELACLLGLFAVAPIPWNLVERCLPEIDVEELEDIRDEGLVGRNLLKRVGQGSYQLHQIVQEFCRKELEHQPKNGAHLKKAFMQAMVGVAKSIDSRPTIDQIEKMTDAISHLEEVCNTWKEFLLDKDWMWPYSGLGNFYEGLGNYVLAERWRCEFRKLWGLARFW